MLTDFFATKLGMTQAWTTSGKRLAITRCQAADLAVVSVRTMTVINKQLQEKPNMEVQIAEIGVGRKKLANMKKPLRQKVANSGFSFGVRSLRGLRSPAPTGDEQAITAGQSISVDQVLNVGDVVQVQGVTKGKGFAGAVKRYGFHGGPKTHGQSDRTRAVGSIGAGTTPGRVFIGKRMPGRMGGDNLTVKGLVVVHIDPTTKELWLSGPVPGMATGQVMIRKTGEQRTINLDKKASGIKEVAAQEAPTEPETTETEPTPVEEPTEVVEAPEKEASEATE